MRGIGHLVDFFFTAEAQRTRRGAEVGQRRTLGCSFSDSFVGLAVLKCSVGDDFKIGMGIGLNNQPILTINTKFS